MHTYLRAWREHRDLSLEAVAAMLGVRHTTVGRWESGKVNLKTQDLERLAKVYHASVSQLMAPPETAEMVSKLDRLQAIAGKLDEAALADWIAIGERLVK